MRTIQISTGAFAKIWSHRKDGEETENEILERLLGLRMDGGKTSLLAKPDVDAPKMLWRDDVRAALTELGGKAALSDLYMKVRRLRLNAGRTVPLNADAIIRRELENNSSDSNTFSGRFDWFRSVNGLGSGIWALRGTEEGR